MTRPNSLPDKYVIRYEGRMYKNSSCCKATSNGWELGEKYAKSIGTLSLEDLASVIQEMSVPRSISEKKVYKLSFALGYLKQLEKYNPDDLEQQAMLDAIIG